MPRRPLPWWLLLPILTTAYLAASMLGCVVDVVLPGDGGKDGEHLVRILLLNLPWAGSLAAMTVLIRAISRDISFEHLGRLRAIGTHLGCLLLLAPAHGAVYATSFLFLEYLFGVYREDLAIGSAPQVLEISRFTYDFAVYEVFNFPVLYGLVGTLSLAIDYHRKYRESELATSQLASQLAQSQLRGLKMQLHPHFLFNTLNAIATLMHRDLAAADRMLRQLGDLLRSSLMGGGRPEVELESELQWLMRYLAIEQVRYSDRLVVQLEVEDQVSQAFVPCLILQPLVENAIRHGIAPRAAGGCLRIAARRDGSRLCLEVEDNGVGLQKGAAPDGSGLGLANTRRRLQLMYGADHLFELRQPPTGGVLATVRIPLRWRLVPAEPSRPPAEAPDVPGRSAPSPLPARALAGAELGEVQTP